MPSDATANNLTRRRLLRAAAGAGLASVGAPAVMRYAWGQSWRAGDPFSLGIAAGCAATRRLRAVDSACARAAVDRSGNARRHARRRCRRSPSRSRPTTRCSMSCATARPPPSRPSAIRSILMFPVCSPAAPYWYRFNSGDAVSPVGRAVTLPAPGAGRSAALRLRVLLQLRARLFFRATGISPTKIPSSSSFSATTFTKPSRTNRPTVRRHSRRRRGRDAADLSQSLRAISARSGLGSACTPQVPAMVTWDDHEVQNDYADKWSEYFDDPALFLHAARGGLSGVLRAHAGAADPVASRTGR